MQGEGVSRGQGRASVTAQNKARSEGTGLGLCPDSATSICVALGEFLTLPASLPTLGNGCLSAYLYLGGHAWLQVKEIIWSWLEQ